MIIDVGLDKTLIYDELNGRIVHFKNFSADELINALDDYLNTNICGDEIYMEKTSISSQIGEELKKKGYQVLWFENKTWKDIYSGGGISTQNLGDATDVLRGALHLNSVTAPTEGININPPTVIPNKKEMVDHPSHYGGKNNPYEAIKVIRAWDLNFSLGSAVKYIARAGKKDLKGDMLASTIEDLKKSIVYINEEIEALQKEYEANGYQD